MLTMKKISDAENLFGEGEEVWFYRDSEFIAVKDNAGMRFVDWSHDFTRQKKVGTRIAKLNDRNYYRVLCIMEEKCTKKEADELYSRLHKVDETKKLSDGSRIRVQYQWIEY